MHYGLLTNITDWLTNAASDEFVALSLLMQDFQLSDGHDGRQRVHGSPFSTRAAYGLIMHENNEDDHADMI